MLPNRTHSTLLVAIICTVSSFAVSNSAEAAPLTRRSLRPGTKPMAFQIGQGPSMNVHRATSVFKMSQEFNFHFSGNASGPAIAVMTEEEFTDGMLGFTLAPKFVYDMQILPNIGFYISPSVSLGYHGEAWSYSGDRWHHLNMQFDVAAKLILKNLWLLWAQPTNINVMVDPGDGWAGVRYEFMVGAGVIF